MISLNHEIRTNWKRGLQPFVLPGWAPHQAEGRWRFVKLGTFATSDFWQINTTSTLRHRRIMPTSVWCWRCNAFWIGDCVWLRLFGGKCGQYCCKFDIPSVPGAAWCSRAVLARRGWRLYSVIFFVSFLKQTNDMIACSISEAKKDGFLRAFLKEALGSFVQHVKLTSPSRQDTCHLPHSNPVIHKDFCNLVIWLEDIFPPCLCHVCSRHNWSDERRGTDVGWSPRLRQMADADLDWTERKRWAIATRWNRLK